MRNLNALCMRMRGLGYRKAEKPWYKISYNTCNHEALLFQEIRANKIYYMFLEKWQEGLMHGPFLWIEKQLFTRH